MRKATEKDLLQIAEFIVKRFNGLEFFSFLSEKLKEEHKTLTLLAQMELKLFIAHGDVVIYDDDITGIISGISSHKYNFFYMLMTTLKLRHLQKQILKSDLEALAQNSKLVRNIHQAKWCRKYTKNYYYIGQVAVSKEAKGTGVLRALLSPFIEQCAQQQQDIVLETHTFANVGIYEHFGFQLMETHTHPDLPFSEYCLIKTWK